jgi:hypothetical protein
VTFTMGRQGGPIPAIGRLVPRPVVPSALRKPGCSDQWRGHLPCPGHVDPLGGNHELVSSSSPIHQPTTVPIDFDLRSAD